ncbi:hypothetical protein F5884DRAFT_683144, partial [Xylogone sp. PMI_703]
CWCGSSDEEAIAMGCRYDHIAVDWLPNDCIDDELTAEFDRAGPGLNGSWNYYTKLHGGHLINNSEIDDYAITATDYFATREWHIAHCIFTWRKQFRSRSTGKIIEPWNEKEEHIKHCGSYIMRAIKHKQDLDEVDTHIYGKARHDRE